MRIYSNDKKITLEDYSANVLSKNIRPYDLEVVKYKYRNMVSPIFVKTYPSSYLLELEISVESETHEKTLKNMMKLIPVFYNCSFVFNESNELGIQNDDTFEYSCIMNSYDFEFVTPNLSILKLACEAEIYSKEKRGRITNLTKSIMIDGAKDTRINFEIYAHDDLTNFHLNDFIIKKLANGKTLIINSVDGLITVDGSIYTKRENISFNNFPQAVGKYDISISNANADIYYSYKGRW